MVSPSAAFSIAWLMDLHAFCAAPQVGLSRPLAATSHAFPLQGETEPVVAEATRGVAARAASASSFMSVSLQEMVCHQTSAASRTRMTGLRARFVLMRARTLQEVFDLVAVGARQLELL